MIKIVIDENIPFAQNVFSAFGDIILMPGREMTAADVKQADALLVRSVTQVNADLLEGSAVRFVGTATIGTDHIDLEYLKKRNITFTSAAGSNANSVVEYVLTAILVLAEKFQWQLKGKTLGIIGNGNIGSRLAEKASCLGLSVLLNDPPKQRKEEGGSYCDLESILESDIITCHVPLTKTGNDSTFHLLNAENLSKLNHHQILINTSRGSVVDNQALKQRCLEKRSGPLVLDVWENEPDIDVELLKYVDIGTPHIAGYSMDGKVNGTIMLYDALCDMLQMKKNIHASDLLGRPDPNTIEIDAQNISLQAGLCEALTTIYPIQNDNNKLCEAMRDHSAQRPINFDQLRKKYPIRREAHNYLLNSNLPNEWVEILSGIGFGTM